MHKTRAMKLQVTALEMKLSMMPPMSF